ncbi:hypothetical protein HYALB_00009277 [Hymenoscyphus albidus]|uniref:Uncharacterized protein n=1 Tax=Hymenoscyphus albidus TaxID=595503 RepID=A0A9N9LNV9_9HELO|nr:hypothetical protein HYALB_00009277 [Hymenoscyphus albidus]
MARSPRTKTRPEDTRRESEGFKGDVESSVKQVTSGSERAGNIVYGVRGAVVWQLAASYELRATSFNSDAVDS